MPKPISIPFSKSQAARSPEETQEQIRHLAYQLYEQRGREDGHDLDDWLTAESEVNAKVKASAA